LKNYINDTDLLYQIIISKGRGKITKELETMLLLIVNELGKKFIYKNYNDLFDCKGAAILRLFEIWQNFNELKYDKALPYFTEIAKREFAKCYNKLNWIRWDKTYPKLINLDKLNR